jgi:hypothetical protein
VTAAITSWVSPGDGERLLEFETDEARDSAREVEGRMWDDENEYKWLKDEENPASGG